MSRQIARLAAILPSAIFLLTIALVTSVHAQIPPVGSPDAFDVATWNIEWFGDNGNGPNDDDLQLEIALDVIRSSDIEFWALQEIANTFSFIELVDSLGDNWVGQLATMSSGNLRTAFLYDTDRVRLNFPIHVLTDQASLTAFAGRPPLRLTTDVLLPDTTVNVTLFTIHMKCCGGTDDKARRQDAGSKLKTHADFALPADRPIIILGDYNDQLISSISGGQTPYQNFLDDPENYLFTSTQIDTNREYTWCRNGSCNSGSTLDHIVVSNELFPHLVDQRAYRMESVLDVYPLFVNEASDHIPVYASFLFPTSTATESIAEQPRTIQIRSVFPNPVTDRLTIDVEGPIGSFTLTTQIGVEVVDVLGRTIDVSPINTGSDGSIEINTSGLSPGFYVVRVSDGQHAAIAKFVKGR